MKIFRKYERGDKLSANALNKIADNLPKYDNITNGVYTDCGNGQVILQTFGGNKFGGSEDTSVQKSLLPFTVRWICTSKTDKDSGEWQIYLPMGCAILDGTYTYFPKNDSGKNKEDHIIFQWYKLDNPKDADASVITEGGYAYKEWSVYVHFKDFPMMYVSTIKDDSKFKASEDLIVGSIRQTEWNDKGGKKHYKRSSINFMTSSYNRTLANNVGDFQIIYEITGDKKSEDSYHMKLTNQQIRYGVRGVAFIKDDTEITTQEEVVLKIDHSTEDVKIEIVNALQENTLDATYVRILKLEDKAIKIDNRIECRKNWPFYGK